MGIFVNEHCQYNILHEVNVVNDIIESLFIEILIPNTKNLITGWIYRPPASNVSAFNNSIYEILNNKCLRKNQYIFLAGDFNINLLGHDLDNNTNDFVNILLALNLRFNANDR